jgi:methyl-accepting chemotaxis protein
MSLSAGGRIIRNPGTGVSYACRFFRFNDFSTEVFFMRLKLSTQLLFFVVIVILTSVGITSAIGFYSVTKTAESNATRAIDQSLYFMKTILKEKGDIRIEDDVLKAGNYTLEGNTELVDRVKDVFGGVSTIFKGDTRISTNVMTDDGQRAVGTKLEGIAYDTVFKAGESYNGEAMILGEKYLTEYEPVKDSAGNVIAILFSGVKESDHFSEMEKIRNRILLSGLIILVVFSFIMYHYAKRIGSVVKGVSLFADGLSRGDLSIDTHIERSDEFGELIQAMRSLRDKLNEIVKGISSVSLSLSSSAEELSASAENFSRSAQGEAASAEEMTATIEELDAGMESVAGSASSQLESIESLKKMLESLSGVIRETGDQILKATNVATDITGIAENGKSLLRQMHERMEGISRGSSEMQNIVEMINEISDQINLLSLNASIEAARAGDAGRGFAVVAQEISKLADQTATSIKGIDEHIKHNNNEIELGLAEANKTVLAIENMVNGVETISSMMTSLNEYMVRQEHERSSVESGMNDVVARSEDIHRASMEQKSAVGEIVRAVSTVTETTQVVAGGSEEMTANADELSTMAVTLKEKIDFFHVK